MLSQFRSYQLALEFYKLVNRLRIPSHLKNQLLRASSGIALCLAEGYGRASFSDKTRFYQMALGSLRESQAVLALADVTDPATCDMADHLGACLFKLTRPSLRTVNRSR